MSNRRSVFVRGAAAGVILLALVGCLLVGAPRLAQGTPPADVDAIYKRGLKAQTVSGVVKAAKELAVAAEHHSNPGAVLNRAGMLYLRVGQAPGALSAFQKAIALRPDLVTARCGLGRVYLDLLDSPRKALIHLEAAVETDPTYKWTYGFLARALAEIGRDHLKAGVADSARVVFSRAIGHDPGLMAARTGLARIFLELEDDAKKALPHLQDALAADSTHAEVHYLLAVAYREMGRPEARHAADRAIRYDPRFPLPYLLLAQSHEEEGNRAAAMLYYRKYLERKPVEQQDVYDFTLKLLQQGRYQEAEELASLMTGQRSLPVLAQALMHRGDYEGAMRAFKLYLDGLGSRERDLYLDISLVGLPREAEAYKSQPPEKREAYLQQFWMRLDPFRVSAGAMRRTEHYRRVWHARTHYGQKKWPWDRRGEVYIRYGDPDYRSASDQLNANVPPDVQRVQDGMAYQLYGAQGLGITFVGPVFPIRTELGYFTEGSEEQRRDLQAALIGELGLAVPEPSEEDPGGAGTGATAPTGLIDLEESPLEAGIDLEPEFSIGLSGWKPITVGHNWASVNWEVWVYADVGKGLEVAFTDELNAGVYDFAPMPGIGKEDLDRLDKDRHVGELAYLRLVQRLTEHAPATRVAKVASKEPQRYDLSEFDPLDFFYDTVSFRGEGGATELQVNFGIPIENVVQPEDADTSVVVNRRLALVKDRYYDVMRAKQDLEVPVGGRRKGRALLDRVDLPGLEPGDYELAVQVQRHNTNRLQVYAQELAVEDYSGTGLALSDLFVAKEVGPAEGSRDPKFVRGKWAIRPMPSHVFDTGQHLFVYFEIYNLARDEFGATKYEVAYEVHARDEEGGLTPILMRILGRSPGAAVTVRYEQTGTEETVSDYVELEIGEAGEGRRRIQMTVKDLNSGQEASKEGVFWVKRQKE